MAAIISKEDILKSIQAMSKDERLKLIAEIAVLPDSSEELPVKTKSADQVTDVDPKMVEISRQVMDTNEDLFQRFATWTEDTSQKMK